MKKTTWAIALFLVAQLQGQPAITIAHFEQTSPTEFAAQLQIDVPKSDAFYADYFSFSSDNPAVSIVGWEPSKEPVAKFDPTFKQTKKKFTEPFNVTINGAIKEDELADFNLHVGYYQQSHKKSEQILLAFNKPASQVEKPLDAEPVQAAIIEPPKVDGKKSAPSFSSYLSNVLETTESTGVRLLLSLLLGLLLSLTPCIYPMIPITMGILQAQGSKSMGRNFSLSLAYTIGIATTFAMLGLMAAFTGKMFGSIMSNPFVILFIVALLAYLAGSMLGLYEMYIPSFMQPKNQSVKGGSLLSVFMFGAASGTVASPCLSPGLLLLLTLVTGLGSIALGFALLFAFGFGLGIPLLIIGTFSGSLNMMPQAGMWMVDVKQFFGFIMLGTCFYFLSLLLPQYLIAWGIVLLLAAMGLFYLHAAKKATGSARQLKNLVGIFCIAAFVYAIYFAYKKTDLHFQIAPQENIWLYDFKAAEQIALAQNKLVLLDVSAPYCSICKAIDKKLFQNPAVMLAFKQLIPVKIEDIEATIETKELQKQFKIVGAPTIILWDPADKKEVQRWGAELYDYTIEQFISYITK